MWGSAQTVTVGDHPLRVVRRGKGSPLLLINGIGAPAEMWAPLAACLSGRELVAVDLPGVGSTPPSHRPLRMHGLADLVARLLDELGHDRIDVLGYSFGGSVAQELAWRAPDRVRRLVLCASTSGLGSAPPRPLAAMMVMTPARYENRTLARWIMPALAGGRTRRDAAVLEATLTQRLANPPSRIGYLHQLYAITGWSSHPWLRRVRNRTLIVHGDQDPLVPVINAHLMAKAMPDARLHVLEGAGHLFLVDEPGSVVGEIGDFLSPAA
jgi:pimeloyl-ACP methyl ester carboxylesterase